MLDPDDPYYNDPEDNQLIGLIVVALVVLFIGLTIILT